jgi:hypothetical protein
VSDYDPAIVTEELGELKAHGLTMTRSFFFWPDFMPDPREIEAPARQRWP